MDGTVTDTVTDTLVYMIIYTQIQYSTDRDRRNSAVGNHDLPLTKLKNLVDMLLLSPFGARGEEAWACACA